MRSFILLGIGQSLFFSSLLIQVWARGFLITDLFYLAIFVLGHLVDQPRLMAFLLLAVALISFREPLYAFSLLLASQISFSSFKIYKEQEKLAQEQQRLNVFYEKALQSALGQLALTQERLETFICEPPSYRYEPDFPAPMTYTGYDETLDVLEKKIGLQFKPEKTPLKRLRRVDSRQTTLFDFLKT